MVAIDGVNPDGTDGNPRLGEQGGNPSLTQGSNPEGSNPEGSNPIENQDSNLNPGGNQTTNVQGSNPGPQSNNEDSNPSEGGNLQEGGNLAQGGNLSSSSSSASGNSSDQSTDSNPKDSDSERIPTPPPISNSPFQAIPGDSEIMIRRNNNTNNERHRASPIDKIDFSSDVDEQLYTLEQWNDIQRRCGIASDNAVRQSKSNESHCSGQSTTIKNPETDKIIDDKVIGSDKHTHRSRRVQTSTIVFDVIKANRIHRGDEKRRQLDIIHTQLEQAGLLTMLLGQREQPIIQSLTDTGYTKERLILQQCDEPTLNTSTSSMSSLFADKPHQPVYITLPEDDIYLYNYDKARLMALVPFMFHDCYAAYGEQGKKNKNPVQYYNDIYNHVFGNTVKDINSTWEAITVFKINKNAKFHAEWVRWERLFENAKFARGKDIDEDQKMAFLMKHVYPDKRLAWHSTMQMSQAQKLTYNQCIQALHDATDAVPDNMQTEQVFHMSQSRQVSGHSVSRNTNTDKPKRDMCRNYLAGTCRRTDCRYSHDDTSQIPQKQSNTSTSSNKSQSIDKSNRSTGYTGQQNQRRDSSKDSSRRTYNNNNNKNNNNQKSNTAQKNISSSSSQQPNNNNNRNASSSHVNRLEAEHQDDFQSWHDTNSRGYRNGSFSSLSLKRRRYKEDMDEEERDKERAWEQRRQAIRDRADRQDVRSTNRENENRQSNDRNEQPSPSPARRASSPSPSRQNRQESPSPPCRESDLVSQTSNETRRPVPAYRRSRNREPPPSRQPYQAQYMHSLDGSYADYNIKHISNNLTQFKYSHDRHPYNAYIVSALLQIETYYSTPDMINYYATYRTDFPNIGIAPESWLYTDLNDKQHLRLFNWNSRCDNFDHHARTDITNNQTQWYTVCIKAAVTAFAAIVHLPFHDNTPNQHYTIFFPQAFKYNNSRDYGHYWSQQTQITDYFTHINAIGFMKVKCGEASNEILIDTLLCAIVYDFMAFTSQILGVDRTYDIERVKCIRNILENDVRRMNRNTYFYQNHFHTIFSYIIDESIPVFDPYRHMVMIEKYSRILNKEHLPDNLQSTQLTLHSNRKSKISASISYLSLHRFNAVTRTSNRIIIDTGASLCATSDKTLLTNLEPCTDMIAYPAFGKQIKPKLRGAYGNLQLEALVIPSMPDTLISVSQLCYGGNSKKHNVAIFTTEGVRVFQFDSVREALKLIHNNGVEILRGYESDGIYVTDKKEYTSTKTHKMFLAQFKPESLYDHIHLVTGHCGEKGIKWHRDNSLNAKYNDKDENRNRGMCQGCIFGALGPTNTDQYRQHREIPLIPGQCFSLDAYTHHCYSSRGRKYCNLFTDLATRRIYPVFTKDRTAQELCEQARMLFLQKPDWQTNSSKEQIRFIRLDSEANYQSQEFLAFTSSIGYNLERTPVRDKHANGVAERSVGLIASKTNVAMMSPTPKVPQSYWDFAMAYACDTNSYNYSSVIGTSPYMKITGQPVNIKYLQPFWSACYVFIPREERNKVGSPRAYKAHFLGYANTNILFPNYIVLPVNDKGQYMKYKDSKNVIFDPTINFSVYTENEEPYDREFDNVDHYVPFLQRNSAPDALKGPNAHPEINDDNDTHIPLQPQRTPQSQIRHETPAPPVDENKIENNLEREVENINDYHHPYEEDDGNPVYWYKYFVKNTEYPLIMCEAQHFKKIKIAKDPTVPDSYYKAMRFPEWREAIDKELTKFEKNLCLQLVPFNNQHLVPMMWTFIIKSDGTKKARLVGQGDLMLPYIDFDPYAVYCGNVTASSIKICIAIAAKYKLMMKGGDLEGAYLVTRANPNYPVYIKTPQGYSIPKDKCIQAVGNLYGFPPAGQNFSIEFDKCVKECGYVNTPWDLKFFYKWKNGKPILLIVHSDDFRWFGDSREMNEWKLLVTNFEKHKYKVTDVTENEFVGIKITRDEHSNYFMDQTRMIDEILSEAHMKNEKDEKLPYPNPSVGLALSKLDNATDENAEECRKYPYRRIIGQLMYGMVHTMVTIMYPLNVLSRYGNNPGPRHIQFAKHLLRYVRTTKKDRLRFNTHEGPYDMKTMTKELQLYFQCDADLAGNLDNNHSQTSYLGYLGGSLICWCSTDQGSISTSTAESEIKAVNHTLKCEVIANRGILTTMGWTQGPTIIEEDNKACIDASVVTHMTKRMRHLALTENFLKEKFADGTCVLKKVDSKNNNADIGTKRLHAPAFDYLTYPLVDRSLRESKK